MSGASESFLVLLVASSMLSISVIIQNFILMNNLPIYLSDIGNKLMLFVLPIMGYGIAKSVYNKNAAYIVLIIMLIDLEPSFLYTVVIGLVVPMLIMKMDKTMKKEYLIKNTVIKPLLYSIIIITPSILVKSPTMVIESKLMNLIDYDLIKLLILCLIGAGISWDFGGPINKSSALIANGLYLNGFRQAVVVKMTVGMIVPVGIGIALLINRKKRGKRLIIDGLNFYNECLIKEDRDNHKRVIITSLIGATVTSILIAYFNIDGYAVQGGILMALTYFPLKGYLISLLIGIITTSLVFIITANVRSNRPIVEEKFNLDDYKEEY